MKLEDLKHMEVEDLLRAIANGEVTDEVLNEYTLESIERMEIRENATKQRDELLKQWQDLRSERTKIRKRLKTFGIDASKKLNSKNYETINTNNECFDLFEEHNRLNMEMDELDIRMLEIENTFNIIPR